MPDPYYRNPIDGYEMLLVPAGKAVFGETSTRFEAELPDYYLGIYSVTNAQYAAFLNAVQPSRDDLERWIHLWEGYCHVVGPAGAYQVDDPERYADHPVLMVSWHGAQAYCEWAGLRLPTELEWEKGARGVDGRVYPWGDEWDPENCHHAATRSVWATCAVYGYVEGISVWGLHNMIGNACEWCVDWYEKAAYKRYAGGDLTPPSRGDFKAVRGGAYGADYPWDFRCASRFYHPPFYHGPIGFRCARGLAR